MRLINIGVNRTKRSFNFIESNKIIKEELNYELTIIGDGHLLNDIKEFININKLKKIKLIKNTDNPYKEIIKSDLFILTSKYEGMPNVLIEALQCKTYIIATDCPTGPKELLNNGRYGTLFKVGDYIQLANQIIEFSKNKSSFNKKINKGYKSLNRFDNRLI